MGSEFPVGSNSLILAIEAEPESSSDCAMTTLSTNTGNVQTQSVSSRRRTLFTACAAHALHDGYTDLIYLLLPIWQAEFAIGYGALAFLRGLTAASVAGLQVPAGRVAEHFGGRATLALGTALAAMGYVAAGYSAGLAGLCVALVVIGCGLSTQHPIASAAVSRTYQGDSRGPLGTYNFAGDIGKAAIPSGASLLLALMSWHYMLWILAALGAIIAVAVAIFLPANLRPMSTEKKRGLARPARVVGSRCS
jgi:MFS transporter, FSR family, fosmidomycin resistance protein